MFWKRASLTPPTPSSDSLEDALESGSYEELSNTLLKIRDLGFEKKCARLVYRAKLKTERIEKFQVRRSVRVTTPHVTSHNPSHVTSQPLT